MATPPRKPLPPSKPASTNPPFGVVTSASREAETSLRDAADEAASSASRAIDDAAERTQQAQNAFKDATQQTSAQVAKVFDTATSQARDLQENVRKATEKGVEETRAAYARIRNAAEDATGSLETSYAVAAKGMTELNAKALDAMRANANATFDLVKSLVSAKSLAEAITLQTEHARKQFESFTAQAKELSSLAQRVASDSVEPIRSRLGKSFDTHL